MTARWRIGAMTALVAGLAVAGWAGATRWRPSTTTYPIQGVDVSADSGAIDWPAVAASGAAFAYIAATDGVAGRDPAFATNWAGARAAGLRRGALHRYSPCQSGTEQANGFVTVVPRVADALPVAVAIDVADCPPPSDREAPLRELERFVTLVERHTGEPVILRIPPAAERSYGFATELNRSLWATGDYRAPGYLPRSWQLWRANDARRIDGVEHRVGWNVVAP